jgi:hypothetical protein
MIIKAELTKELQSICSGLHVCLEIAVKEEAHQREGDAGVRQQSPR